MTKNYAFHLKDMTIKEHTFPVKSHTVILLHHRPTPLFQWEGSEYALGRNRIDCRKCLLDLLTAKPPADFFLKQKQ